MKKENFSLPAFTEEIVLPQRYVSAIVKNTIEDIVKSKKVTKAVKERLSLRYFTSLEFQTQVEFVLRFTLLHTILSASFEMDFECDIPDMLSQDKDLQVFYAFFIESETNVVESLFESDFMVPMGLFQDRMVAISLNS